jgi:hypothetical protein
MCIAVSFVQHAFRVRLELLWGGFGARVKKSSETSLDKGFLSGYIKARRGCVEKATSRFW